jgi:DNA gyrase subunit A
LKATDKTGTMVAIKEVLENDDIVLVTAKGIIIRQPAKSVRLSGRNTQGVRLIRLESGDHTAAVAIVRSEEDEAAEKEAESAQMTLDEQVADAGADETPAKEGKKAKGGAKASAKPKPAKATAKPGRSKKK